jgi:carboxyl-terminal processing protease
MDLLDGPHPSSFPPAPESFMRRFRKLLILVGACALALFLTIQHHGESLRVATDAPLAAAVGLGGADYQLEDAWIFSKTLFYVKSHYFDQARLDHKRMLVGALDFLQRDVPEILVDRVPEQNPEQVIVRVNGKSKTFSIKSVDSPWSHRTRMQEIFRFIQQNLPPVGPKEALRRLVDIETAAANGMLYTLDPHSMVLDADSFRDMRTTTQGKFGGLGIVIGINRQGHIRIQRVLPDNPAAHAGLKAHDHIVRINNESTENMTLQEAVERLRGDPGKPVIVYVKRKEPQWKDGQKSFTVVRDIIQVRAIYRSDEKILSVVPSPGAAPVKIGYFRIGSFSANTDSNLNEVLGRFKEAGVKGLIMDLRDNSGGLYDQAQKVADAFIEAGVLVSMVGAGGIDQKDEHATREAVRLPLAVLVNQQSASASEIVAGAIKNLDRGVVIGEATFGKGSVQRLFEISSPIVASRQSQRDMLGLKLTTAQYLTPGGLSIQSVGVTPDIALVPLHVEKEKDVSWIRLQNSSQHYRESDYQWHLDHPSASPGQGPSETISFLYVPPPGKDKRQTTSEDEDDDDDGADDDEGQLEEDGSLAKKIDYPIEFARDLLAQTDSEQRKAMLTVSQGFFGRVRAAEDKKVAEALGKLGVDWSVAPPAADRTAPRSSETSVETELRMTLTPSSQGASVPAGASVQVRGSVKNLGPAIAHRVRAVLKSDNLLFDENEMVFGKIAVGETKTYEVNARIPKSSLTRTDAIEATVRAQRPVKANTATATLQIEGKKRPLFAYAYQTLDDKQGNQDGQVQKKETVRLLVRVKNIGQGPALRTEASLRNGRSQDGILISHGRFQDKELAPGEVRQFAFVYEVTPEFKGEEFELQLMVGDRILRESVSDNITIRLAPQTDPVTPASGTVRVSGKQAPLREAPRDDALVVGKAPPGAAFTVTGRVGDFTRVALEADRFAFLRSSEVEPGGASNGQFEPVWHVRPPVLTVNAPIVTRADTVRVRGTAIDDEAVKDLFIRVWNRASKLPPKKVFYTLNDKSRAKLAFEADVPVWPGSNLIQVFARDNHNVQTIHTMAVLQETPAPLVHKTPAPALAPQQ